MILGRRRRLFRVGGRDQEVVNRTCNNALKNDVRAAIRLRQELGLCGKVKRLMNRKESRGHE
mgnify:CR=1 FL=1